MRVGVLSRVECSALRGVAIVLIMSYNFVRHLIHIDGNEMRFSAEYTEMFCRHWYEPLYVVSFAGWTGVCVFLFLSGYGLYAKYGDGLRGKEVVAFYRLHLVKVAWMSLPLMALYYVLNGMVTGRWGFVLPGPYWFFPLILECYLVFPVLARWKTEYLGVLAVAGMAFNAVCLYCPVGETFAWFVKQHIFGWYVSFVMGIVIARHGWRDEWWFRILIPAALCASLVVKPLTVTTDMLTALTCCVLARLCVNRFLVWTGAISSSLFLLHAFVRLFLYEWMDCEGMVYMTTALFLVITFAVGWLHHRYMPGNRFSLRKVRAS